MKYVLSCSKFKQNYSIIFEDDHNSSVLHFDGDFQMGFVKKTSSHENTEFRADGIVFLPLFTKLCVEINDKQRVKRRSREHQLLKKLQVLTQDDSTIICTPVHIRVISPRHQSDRKFERLDKSFYFVGYYVTHSGSVCKLLTNIFERLSGDENFADFWRTFLVSKPLGSLPLFLPFCLSTDCSGDFDSKHENRNLSQLKTSSWFASRSFEEEKIPFLHPIYWDKDETSVFHSLNDIVSELSQDERNSDNACLLKMVPHIVSPTPNKQPHLIIIEGLDGCGKSTLGSRLAEKMSATVMHCPTAEYDVIRKAFNLRPDRDRRLFFSACNYAAARQIANRPSTDVIILDRFWFSTAAYALATELTGYGVDALPPPDHSVYQWPSDLIRPELVVILELGESVRRERLRQRNQGVTAEERRLESDDLFRIRVQTAFSRLRGVPTVKIDASASPGELVHSVFSIYRTKYSAAPKSC